MKSFLGVPIVLRGVAYGNLYLTEKEGGADFTDEDEEFVTLLASQAAVAIENARLYESSRAWAHQLESLEEITSAMLSDIDPARLLHLIVERMSELIDARFVAILTQAGEGWLEIAAAHGEGEAELVGHRLSIERSKSGRVFRDGTSARVDSVLDDPDADPAGVTNESSNQASGRRLAVEPGDLPNAFDGRAVAEGAVGAPLVVVAHPVWQ